MLVRSHSPALLRPGNHVCVLDVPIVDTWYTESYKRWPFVSGFFHSWSVFQVHLCWPLCGNFILFYGSVIFHYTTFDLSVHKGWVYLHCVYCLAIEPVHFSPSVIFDCLQPHGLQHARPPCPSLMARAYSNLWTLSQWCHPIISFSGIPCPPTFSLSQHQGLFQWVSSLHQMVKVLEFQLQHESFQWIFRTEFLLDGLVGSPFSPWDS